MFPDRNPPVLERGPAIRLAQQLLVPFLVGRLAAESRPVMAASSSSSSSVSRRLRLRLRLRQ